MPPLTSLIAGFTLTSTALYLSLLTHQHSRAHQASLLHESALLLDSHSSPTSTSPPTATNSPEAQWQVRDAGWVERWKDGWNREVEGLVRGVQGIRWGWVREGVEVRGREWGEGGRRI
jgi:altered-inheritance-of-mitochondria protein 5